MTSKRAKLLTSTLGAAITAPAMLLATVATAQADESTRCPDGHMSRIDLSLDPGGRYLCLGPPNPPAPAPMPKLSPPPPTKPLAGPGVSWDPVIGGLVAHVTDRSGVASQCTYKADAYTRSFFLPANATYDVVIVPAVPKLANWDISVLCDNGTSTRTSTFF